MKVKIEEVEKFLNKIGYKEPFLYYYNFEKTSRQKASQLLNEDKELTVISYKKYDEIIFNVNCSDTKFYLQDNVNDFRDYDDFDDDYVIEDEENYKYMINDEPSDYTDYSRQWIKFLNKKHENQKTKELKKQYNLEENNDLTM